ncbi:hypothetical protein C1645_815063 [Glomus cerebriforme]|uniref:Uncharacterized protein n=1 Tax=Glomus cerebriforme TaxID=658196 RepID=A0A397TJM5_9GLOM|nr:hypothetical protein C1645_815063 [Glomus cerebriforme]
MVKDNKGKKKLIGFFETIKDVNKACQHDINIKGVNYKWDSTRKNNDKNLKKSKLNLSKKDKNMGRKRQQQDGIVAILESLVRTFKKESKVESRKEKKNKSCGGRAQLVVEKYYSICS